jgi:hypothetical protein
VSIQEIVDNSCYDKNAAEITEKTMAIILDIELCSSSVYLIEAIATAVIGKADARVRISNPNRP